MRSLALFILLFTAQAQAKIIARVLDVGGNSFVFDSRGQSKQLRFGSKIYDMSEVMVDDSSYLTVLDQSDNVHHFSGGSYAKFYNNLLEIKNGYVWTSAKKPALINTINSVISYSSGQFITSVNSSSLKTQVLSLTASPRLASSLEPNLSISVPAGHFSFIDQSYEKGLPRRPTRVGLNSYKNIKGLFANVKGLENTKFEKTLFSNGASSASRKIASVSPRPVEVTPSRKKGKVIFLKTAKRGPASVKKESAMDYYKSVLPKPKKKVVKKPKKVKIKYYGFDFSKKTKRTIKNTKVVIQPVKKKQSVKRVPASAHTRGIINEINSAFEKSLNNKVINNKRHSDEVNQLIDELKSFKKDYSKHY
ncbi:MAG: hypothetical protein CME64_09885 [Halobacteriovoraceae bacterium]|nr:hypothetical protein [Halobacteriovoraceae bacterium]|tara:strand:+ start:64998 stop:66086 length:1089 start_codon:yes stop_codon:yes gene_type:complete